MVLREEIKRALHGHYGHEGRVHGADKRSRGFDDG